MKKSNIKNLGARNLVEAGKKLDLNIHEYIIQKTNAYNIPLSYLSILSSLTWPGHAKDLNPFYSHGEKYLSSGDQNELKLALEYAGRFGKDALYNTLQGWHTLIHESDFTRYEFETLNANDYHNIQNEIHKSLNKLIKARKISGIGEWFFYAPFKIFLEYRRDLWNDEQIDQVRMPIGRGVRYAIKILIKNKFKYVTDIDNSMLGVENSSIADNFATAEIIHKISLEIAHDSRTRVLHVNSGLFELGENKIL